MLPHSEDTGETVPSCWLLSERGLCGCPSLYLRWLVDWLGCYFQSILVHIESLFPVQTFDKLTRSFSHCPRKTRGIHLHRRFHGSLTSILIAKSHLKRFHAAAPYVRRVGMITSSLRNVKRAQNPHSANRRLSAIFVNRARGWPLSEKPCGLIRRWPYKPIWQRGGLCARCPRIRSTPGSSPSTMWRWKTKEVLEITKRSRARRLNLNRWRNLGQTTAL